MWGGSKSDFWTARSLLQEEDRNAKFIAPSHRAANETHSGKRWARRVSRNGLKYSSRFVRGNRGVRRLKGNTTKPSRQAELFPVSRSDRRPRTGPPLRAWSAATIASGKPRVRGVVVDLFCGAGGLTHGFRQQGFKVAAGIDIDEDCRFPFETNNDSPFIRRDVGRITAAEVKGLFKKGEPSILVGCAPCQPFSIYNQKNEDPKWKLVTRFARLICDVRPDFVSMENVPRLLRFQGGDVFDKFVDLLSKAGYRTTHEIVYAPDYGVPQSRYRLVVLASRHGTITLRPPTHRKAGYLTARNAIEYLPELVAGGVDSVDELHRASRLSSLNLRRIRASRPGGSWRDWTGDLIAECHQVKTGKGYASVYGRMQYDEPAPTITTQFFGFGNGRFGHPTQDRGLSLREGALLQSFPPDYKFVRPGETVHFKRLGKLIGNAVPVLLSAAIAETVRAHISRFGL